MAPATNPLHHHGSGSDGTTPRALDPAEKQPQDFTHSAVVQQLLFGSDATEGEDTELQWSED